MAIDFPLFDNDHVLGEGAMRPIAPRLTRQAALGWARQRPCDTLRLVGTSHSVVTLAGRGSVAA